MSITIKSDGSVTVQTVAEAAEIMKLLNGKNGAHKPEFPMFASAGLPDAPTEALPDGKKGDADTLLRAGGMKLVRSGTLRVYEFLLDQPNRAWTAQEIAKRLKRDVVPTSALLSALYKRKIIERVGFGQYKAK